MQGYFECFHCLHMAVAWDSDFDFDDFGYEGEGIVHELHCCNCGASITYVVPIEKEKEND